MDGEPDADEFWQRVETLRAARCACYSADADELTRVVEFLERIEVLAVEIKQFLDWKDIGTALSGELRHS